MPEPKLLAEAGADPRALRLSTLRFLSLELG